MFDEIKPVHTSKWDLNKKGVIPLFLADMDFPTAPGITEALVDAMKGGNYSYAWASMELFALISAQYKLQYQWSVEPDSILTVPGLLHAIDTIFRSLANPGDEVLLLTPEYPGILKIMKHQCVMTIEVPLKEHQGDLGLSYSICFDSLEEQVTCKTKFILFSSPHNPTGTVFDWKTCAELARFCIKHDIVIISDEIWSPLVLDDTRFVPMGSLSEEVAQRCITLLSPSKAYNLGGLAAGLIIVQNEYLRQKITQQSIPYSSIQSYVALLAAYKEDGQWLVQKKSELSKIKERMTQFFQTHVSHFSISADPATYLLWVKTHENGKRNWVTRLEDECNIIVNPGPAFGLGFDDYFRLTCATRPEVLDEVCHRILQLIKGL